MKEISVLDGGMATLLESNFHQVLSTNLWSSAVLLSNPDHISKVHALYIEAGAGNF
jgi:S-methylmethionine-dependent homocysteine/selenocysteine methylase